MKRLVSLLLVLVMSLSMFTLVACNGGTVDQTTTTTTTTDGPGIGEGGGNVEKQDSFVLQEGEEYDGSEVEIVFSHTMGQNLRDVLDYYIGEFNKIYPNITITHTQVGGYDDVRKTVSEQILAGNQPNIAYCYPDHVALYNLANAVVTLDQFINSPFGMDQATIDAFIDGYWNEGKVYGDGLMYTLPLSKSTEVLYYNKTYFEANHLSVPTTWDELEAVCNRIIEIEGADSTCIPLGYDSEANWFITMTEQLGTPYTSATGTKYLFNTAENRQFVKRFAEMYKNGLLTTQEIFGAYTSGMFVEQKRDGSAVYSYMSIGSSAGATHQRPEKVGNGYPFEVGIAPIPQVDSSNSKVISQGPSLVILNNENRQEVIASYLFVEYLTTNIDFQAEFSIASGYMPVLETVMENEVYAEYINSADGYDNVTALSIKVSLEQKDSYFVSPAFSGSSVARDEVGSIIQKVFTDYLNASDPDALIQQVFDEAIAICERKYPSK